MDFVREEVERLNERIKEIRKALGLTQAAFAEKLNLTRPYVSTLESGEKPVTDKLIFNVVNILNVNEEWLRSGEGDMFQTLDRAQEIAQLTANIYAGKYSDFKQKFIELIANADEEQLKVIKTFADKLAESEKE